jgi:hypothetical protein
MGEIKMNDKNGTSATTRLDLPDIEAKKEDLIQARKLSTRFSSEARSKARPERCCICGKEDAKRCNSHTIPQYCLREIAVDGKVYNVSVFLNGNILEPEVGLNKATTFRRICQQCDSEFFKKYETPTVLYEEPSSQVLGQIATKIMLREIDKAKYQIGLNSSLGMLASLDFHAKAEVRTRDIPEDEKNLQIAIRLGKTEKQQNAYHVVMHKVLPYVVPLAFQEQINPVADFEGGLINNVFNPNFTYRIEPLYVAILPSRGKTVVLAFRNRDAKRYREFEKQLRLRSEREQLQAVLKLIFAYSDDIIVSKKLSEECFSNESLQSLVCMNPDYIHFTNDISEALGSLRQQACSDFAIDNLPDPPELLSSEYAIG